MPVPSGIELRDLVSTGVNTAFDRLSERRDLGICLHRMVGTLRGTDGYFGATPAPDR
ncbi:MAG: hypothetical protein R2845_08685 [Thermomicrobiales bacterium]